jgi:hypothetical protein
MGRTGKLAAALLLGLSASVAWAQEKQTPEDVAAAAAKGNGWGLWGAKKKADDKKAAPLPPPGPSRTERAALEQMRQMKAFFRRQEVCTRLEEIALENNDPELERQAQLLGDMNWQVYKQHTAGLPLGPVADDEAVLGGRLATDTALPRPGRAPASRDGGAASLRTFNPAEEQR